MIHLEELPWPERTWDRTVGLAMCDYPHRPRINFRDGPPAELMHYDWFSDYFLQYGKLTCAV